MRCNIILTALDWETTSGTIWNGAPHLISIAVDVYYAQYGTVPFSLEMVVQNNKYEYSIFDNFELCLPPILRC